jgi:nicotinate (nicotinamide) nucleotide adenylyltransferase
MTATQRKRIAVFGGTFNPPGNHHRRIAEALSQSFDEVVVVPCGPRPDKDSDDGIDPIYRATLVHIAFRDLPGVRVELFDLENSTFTTTHELATRLQADGEVWFVVGTDLLEAREKGASPIRQEWYLGETLWQDGAFVVITRAGWSGTVGDLPPRHELIDLKLDGSSSEIRERLFKSEDVKGLLSPAVEAYIRRYGLYQGRLPRNATRITLDEARVLVEVDERNPRAQAIVPHFNIVEQPEDANLIVAIGGDGTMLHAIRKHWKRRLPFFGVNAGRRGFLLNDTDEVLRSDFSFENLMLRQLPLLYVKILGLDGQERSLLAFNDAWVERMTGQTAWIEVRIDDQVQLEKLTGDGVLLATAAGSTAYARALGATPLLVDSRTLLMVGSNIMEPTNWKSAHLSLDSEIEFRTLDRNKRPMVAYADGIPQGEVISMKARVSRTAAAELAFTATHDIGKKLAQIQFPRR